MIALGELPRFPCNAEKKPLVKAWQKVACREANDSRWPLAGVVTGEASGIDILDVDPRNGGDRWYKLNFDALPFTQAHETQSGGLHLLFKHAEGLRKSNDGKIAEGVDILADGAYAIWWPRQGLPVEVHPICEWPEWLLKEAMGAGRDHVQRALHGGGRFPAKRGTEAVVKPKALRDGATEHGSVDHPSLPVTRNFLARSRYHLNRLEQTEVGHRNRMLFEVACIFGEMIAEKRILPSVAEHLLLEANGLLREDGIEQCRKTIASGFYTIERRMLRGNRDA